MEYLFCETCCKGFEDEQADYKETFAGNQEQPPEKDPICPNCGDKLRVKDCFKCDCDSIVEYAFTGMLYDIEDNKMVRFCLDCVDNLPTDCPELYRRKQEEEK